MISGFILAVVIAGDKLSFLFLATIAFSRYCLAGVGGDVEHGTDGKIVIELVEKKDVDGTLLGESKVMHSPRAPSKLRLVNRMEPVS